MTCRQCLKGRLQFARFSSGSEKRGRVCYNVSKRTEKGQHSQGNTTCSRSDFNASLSFQYICQPGPGYVRKSYFKLCSGLTDLFDHVSSRTVLCLQNIQAHQYGQLTFTRSATECILGDHAARNEDATCTATGPSFECQCGWELDATTDWYTSKQFKLKVFQVNSSVTDQNTPVCRTSNSATKCLCDTCVKRGEDGRCISVSKSGPSGSRPRHSPSRTFPSINVKDKCQCMDGFESKNSKHCTNINECALGTHHCSSDANCMDTIGSFHCQCFDGFTGNGRTNSCLNVNECKSPQNNCGANTDCSDTEGSYQCLCRRGFSGSGGQCTNIDECALQIHHCSPNASCNDTLGSYECYCKKGFHNNSVICVNTDECTSKTHTCPRTARCIDTIGAFQCQCRFGYMGNGWNCTGKNCHAQSQVPRTHARHFFVYSSKVKYFNHLS